MLHLHALKNPQSSRPLPTLTVTPLHLQPHYAKNSRPSDLECINLRCTTHRTELIFRYHKSFQGPVHVTARADYNLHGHRLHRYDATLSCLELPVATPELSKEPVPVVSKMLVPASTHTLLVPSERPGAAVLIPSARVDS